MRRGVTKRANALVIGGGIAGLLAARVLADHFERVTLIERDHYPKEPTFRSGAPQGRQLHTILLRGQQAMEILFPGLGRQLLKQGAVERDYGNETIIYYGGGRCPQIPPIFRGWSCSRLLLEWQLRQELMKYPQVHILEGYEVVHLLFDQEANRIRGVQLRARNHSTLTNEIQELKGDLMVDASGSTSPVVDWLKESNNEVPKETIINPYLGYATRLYKIPEQFHERWKGIAIQSTQQLPRSGALMEIEGRRWMVVLAGSGKDYPPTDERGYLAFARSLPDPALYEAMKDAQPLSPIYGYRRTENRLRHFERLRRQPEGFVAIGDAVCAFNPIYGQGMTVAALEALALDTCLRREARDFSSHAFQRKIACIVAQPWRLATASDLRSSSEKKTGRLSQWYIGRIISLLPRDPVVLRTFLEVIHMMQPPSVLLRPAIMARVLKQSALA
jgi:2-polyprenyl-6-methoxyphenol hydroxylase-like FAD-dependent oxidoreductase